jgi:hypothetical protein
MESKIQSPRYYRHGSQKNRQISQSQIQKGQEVAESSSEEDELQTERIEEQVHSEQNGEDWDFCFCRRCKKEVGQPART